MKPSCENGRNLLTYFHLLFVSLRNSCTCIFVLILLIFDLIMTLSYRIFKLLTKMVLKFLNFSTLSQFFIVKIWAYCLDYAEILRKMHFWRHIYLTLREKHTVCLKVGYHPLVSFFFWDKTLFSKGEILSLRDEWFSLRRWDLHLLRRLRILELYFAELK